MRDISMYAKLDVVETRKLASGREGLDRRREREDVYESILATDAAPRPNRERLTCLLNVLALRIQPSFG